ncbi:MAG: hypothetical protein UIH27_11880 [Ruminococcus sp.]|nr:hypothetical protein [Ruminococcus sp.]
MSILIKGLKLPKHSATIGDKPTVYKCAVLAHPDNTVELVIDERYASPYDNGHNIQRYPLTEIPTPHGRLIDADDLLKHKYGVSQTARTYINTANTIIEAEEE